MFYYIFAYLLGSWVVLSFVEVLFLLQYHICIRVEPAFCLKHSSRYVDRDVDSGHLVYFQLFLNRETVQMPLLRNAWRCYNRMRHPGYPPSIPAVFESWTLLLVKK